MNSFLLRKRTRSFGDNNRCGMTRNCGSDITVTGYGSSISLPLMRLRRGRSALVATLHDALTSSVHPTSLINDSSSSSSSSSSPPLSSTSSSSSSLLLSPTRLIQHCNHEQQSLVSPPKRSESTQAATTPTMIDEATYCNADTVKVKNHKKKSKLLLSPPLYDKSICATKKAAISSMPLSRTISTRARTIHSHANAAPTQTTNLDTLSSVSSVKQRRSVLHKATFKSKLQYTKIITKKNYSPNSKTAMGVTSTSTSTSTCHNIITDDSSCADTYNDNRKRSQTVPSSKFPKRIRIQTTFYHDTSSTVRSSPSTKTNNTTTKNYDETNIPSTTVPSSKFPKRIRFPTKFYHATSMTTTTTSNVPSTNVNSANTESIDEMKDDTTSVPPIRPQRKRIQTEFFTPSNLSVMLQFRSNESRCKPPTSITTIEQMEAEHDTSPPSTIESNEVPISNALDNSPALLSHAMDIPSGDLLYETALTGYRQRVTLGHCHPVSFGKTLESALLAIDRKLQTLQTRKSVGVDMDDKEIMADIREYKRSLRAFSVYEDREKLASIQEVQENLELWGRQYASKNIHSKNYRTSDKKIDNNMSNCWTELLLLEKRPVVFASGTRMMSRSAFKCQYGINCIFGCHRKTTFDAINNSAFTKANAAMALIPLIRPFSIDDDDDDNDMSTPTTKNRKTIDSLRELKSSLQFIAAYQDKATCFSS